MERDILVDVRHPFIVHLEYGENEMVVVKGGSQGLVVIGPGPLLGILFVYAGDDFFGGVFFWGTFWLCVC